MALADGEVREAAAPPIYSADGVHLLRTTQQVQYQLSQMADQKASMLLGITFVIFTVAVGQARAATAPQLPLLVLGAAAFLAAILTVSAVLPAIKAPAVSHGAKNILFFDVFSRMTQDEYVDLLLTTVTDTRAIYEAFARDIYQNGHVLSVKKYRLLGWAYRVLLIGLVASAITFVTPLIIRGLGF